MSDEATLTRQRLVEDQLDWILTETFLCQLTTEEQDELLAGMQWRTYPRETSIIRDASEVEGVDLLVQGNAQVLKRHANGRLEPLVQIGPGYVIGERSVLRGQTARAEVRSLSPLTTLHVSAQAFRKLLGSSAHLRQCIEDLVSLRERAPHLMELLLRNPFLRLLDRDDVDRMISSASILRAEAGKRVLLAGDKVTEVFLLIKGRIGLFAPSTDDAPREQLSTEGPGWLAGHDTLLLERPRSVDVDALEQSEFMVVQSATFMRLIAENPAMQRRIFQDVAATPSLQGHIPNRGTLLSVYAARPGLGGTTLAYAVSAHLAHLGPAVLVDLAGPRTAQKLKREVVPGEVEGIPVERMSAPEGFGLEVLWPRDRSQTFKLLDALRAPMPRSGYVVVAAESRDELDQATMTASDSVVFVRRDDDLSHNEAARHGQFRVDAIRLTGNVTLPHNAPNTVRIPEDNLTAGVFWRDGDLSLFLDEQRPLARVGGRVVRVLEGRSVGLALGGGGALGFAHVGLLRALQHEGIPVDYVSGSSFGALVAGLYAADGMRALEALIRERALLLGYVLAGMATSHTITRFVERVVGRRAMSSTEIPFYPVGMDILTGRQIVLANGTVGEGVRASSSLPGPFPAWDLGSWRLVDGGIINNVPASVVWEAGAHFIVASNIIPSGATDLRRTDLVHRVGRALFGRVDDLMRSMYMMMSQAGRDRATLADYIFDLDIHGYNIYDFLRGDVIAEAGLEQAHAQLPLISRAYRDDRSARFHRGRG
ncbi:MAG: cyclic nucleotide-binding domain-containing protein [Deltaproteobacteria bacterium]|nr:cyclic nucleotide-binding domain-containing protein [Deltaproteobacteria bacterium]